MAAPTLEEMAERVAVLEATIARIERRDVLRLGALKDSIPYEEAIRPADEYRKLQPLVTYKENKQKEH